MKKQEIKKLDKLWAEKIKDDARGKDGKYKATLKIIKCKICKKKFKPANYKQKLCSFQCTSKYFKIIHKGRVLAKTTRKHREDCKICGKEYYKDGRCFNCFKQYKYEIDKKYREKNHKKLSRQKKNYYKSGKNYICKQCNKKFQCRVYRKFCSRQCNSLFIKENKIRRGKNNPCYRNGNYTKGKKIIKHLGVCKKYRNLFLKNNNYLFCEYCKTNQSLRFEVHHIVFASEETYHKELHNKQNLILLCIKCHNWFHQKKDRRNELVKQRNLEKLFNKVIIYDNTRKPNT